MKLRRVMTLGGALLAFSAAGAAAGGSRNAEVSAPGSTVYGMAVPNTQNTFYAACVRGFEEGVKKLDPGARVIVTDAQANAARQIDQIGGLLGQGVKAICIIPIDSGGIGTAVAECQSRGVPVFACDTPIFREEGVISTVVSDNYSAGKIAGEWLLKGISHRGKIVTITTASVSAAIIQRKGALTDLLENAPGVSIVLEQIVPVAASEEARILMENAIAGAPDLAGVFTTGDVFAIGICAALRVNGYKPGEVIVTSIDGTNQAVELINSGYLYCTAAQPAYQMGYGCAEAAWNYLNGRAVQKLIELPCSPVSADNVATYVGY
jgi:ribose transport system substrate-binding protein